MQNKDIRKAAKDAGVKLWQIAAKLGISDGAFSRKLRFELSNSEKETIMDIIKNLSEEVVIR